MSTRVRRYGLLEKAGKTDGRNLRSLVVATVAALTLAACSGGEVADFGFPSNSTIAAATTVPSVETTSTTTTVATTTSPVDAADAAIAVVVSAIEAKNRFDLDAWLMAYEGGRRVGTPDFAENILMNARQQWDFVEPCKVTGETSSGDTVVECLLQDINVFWGVGGISDIKAREFTVNADGLITNNHNTFGSARRNAFNRAFHQWLSDTYPDVYSEMGFGSISSNGPGFDRKNPELMLIAVEYVEEFVAQSDKYPLDPTSP
jgi:hypothetical protein